MCGKVTQLVAWSKLVMRCGIHLEPGDEPANDGADDRVEAGTPMRFMRIVALDERGRRRQVRMRWGLVPSWQDDPNKISGTIHARAETIDQKPSFRDAFAKRRGLLLVRTFNEGEELPNGKTRQYVIAPKDGQSIAIAVIWERWQREGFPALLSFAMVTTDANRLIGAITDRMPAVLPEEHWAKWLGEEPASPEELKNLLRPMDGDWEMEPQDPPPGRPPKPPRPGKPDPQPTLF